MATPYTLHLGATAEISRILEPVTDLYLSIRAEPPYNSGALYSRDAFLTRTEKQMSQPGFTFVWATPLHHDDLIGFTFGFTFPPRGWWSGDPPPPPRELLEAAKFAVIELNVKPNFRRQGIGEQLLACLLQGRPEPYAILTTRPETVARKMYCQLGWHQTGTIQHAPDGPVFDQLAIELPLKDKS